MEGAGVEAMVDGGEGCWVGGMVGRDDVSGMKAGICSFAKGSRRRSPRYGEVKSGELKSGRGELNQSSDDGHSGISPMVVKSNWSDIVAVVEYEGSSVVLFVVVL